MREYLETFVKYLFWGMTPALPIVSSAIGQQCIVFAMVWFIPDRIPMPVFVQYIAAVVLFSSFYHLPNLPLMILTLIFAAVFYPLVFIYGLALVPIVAILHALFGSYLYIQGFNLKAWNFEWRIKK